VSAGIAPLIDVDRDTGELIQGWERCKKSIVTILTTRLRTRIMRLWWGSEFLDAQDQPNNQQTFPESILAALIAIELYEPEFDIERVTLGGAGYDGSVEITVEGTYLPDRSQKQVSETITI
jgi:phage baseplate assembly protein W